MLFCTWELTDTARNSVRICLSSSDLFLVLPSETLERFECFNLLLKGQGRNQKDRLGQWITGSVEVGKGQIERFGQRLSRFWIGCMQSPLISANARSPRVHVVQPNKPAEILLAHTCCQARGTEALPKEGCWGLGSGHSRLTGCEILMSLPLSPCFDICEYE